MFILKTKLILLVSERIFLMKKNFMINKNNYNIYFAKLKKKSTIINCEVNFFLEVYYVRVRNEKRSGKKFTWLENNIFIFIEKH